MYCGLLVSAGISPCWAVGLSSIYCRLVVCVGVCPWGSPRMASIGRSTAGSVTQYAVGALGFSTGSPSLDRHLWAVKCGYVPGALVVRESAEMMCMLEWLGMFEVKVKEASAWKGVDTSPDVVRLQLIVGGVLSGACVGSLVRRFPQFGALLHQIIVTDGRESERISSVAPWSGREVGEVGESIDSDGSPPGRA